MDVSNVKIAKCHMLGGFSKHQTRPIIAYFLWYGKSKLPSRVHINEDLPSEWVECRKLLKPVIKKVLKLEHYKGKVKL